MVIKWLCKHFGCHGYADLWRFIVMGGGEGVGDFSFIVRLFYECFVVNYAKRCLRLICRVLSMGSCALGACSGIFLICFDMMGFSS